MELQGKVIAVLDPRSGESARGKWMTQDYVIETHDNFPRKMVFNIFGEDRIKQFNIKAGEEIVVSFDIDAHEYNGRWFNNIRAWNIQRVDSAAAQAANPAPTATPQPAAPTATASEPGPTAPFPPASEAGESTDDLPF